MLLECTDGIMDIDLHVVLVWGTSTSFEVVSALFVYRAVYDLSYGRQVVMYLVFAHVDWLS